MELLIIAEKKIDCSIEEGKTICREAVAKCEGTDIVGFLLNDDGLPLFDYRYHEELDDE